MAREKNESLSITKFFDIISRRCGLSEKTVRKVYNEMFLLISEELRFNGLIRLKRFGAFKVRMHGGRDVRLPDGTYTFVDLNKRISFKPSGEFINFVNGKIVDKEGKKRKRKGKLNTADVQVMNLSTADKEKNLQIAIEKLSE